MKDERIEQFLELIVPLAAEIKLGKLSDKHNSRGFAKVECPVCHKGTITYNVYPNGHTSGKCDGCWVEWRE